MAVFRGVAFGLIGAAIGWGSWALAVSAHAKTLQPRRAIVAAAAVGAGALSGSVGGIAVTFWRGAFLVPFVAVLVACAWIDARTRVIPNRLTYPAFAGYAAAIAAIAIADGGPPDIGGACVGFALFGGGLLAVTLAVPKGMGMGDVKLAGLQGLVLGGFGLRVVGTAAFCGLVAGALASVALLLKGAGRKATLPFGPYLAIGGVIGAFVAARAS